MEESTQTDETRDVRELLTAQNLVQAVACRRNSGLLRWIAGLIGSALLGIAPREGVPGER